MIGYDRLGSNGRFANQLFQFSGLRGIAAHRGYDWVIPPEDHHNFANYGILFPFKMGSMTEKNKGFVNKNVSPNAMLSLEGLRALNPDTQTITESSQAFDQDLFDNCPDNVNLDGYLQTEKYFKHIEDELREDYQFIDGILKPCEEFISEYEKIIFLHVRRTDYVNLQASHPLLSLDYYKEALKHFDEDTYVLICSDDPEWCSNQELFLDDRFLISDDVETYDHDHRDADGHMRKSRLPFVDMCLMSLCNGGIIANSSFSWWGAWLQSSKDKKIIAPSNWYGPNLSHVDDSDLIPETWIKIDEK
tara:strand:- start:983 stop:1894 length:912 start_codon:yes stop_codon:yes gene_type:complete